MHDEDFNFARDFGTASVIVGWHKKYRIGHVQPKQTREEWMREKLQDQYHSYLTINRKFDAQTYYDYCCATNFMEWGDLVKEFEKRNVYVDLYMGDHSSQVFSVGCMPSTVDHQDRGWVGFMYMEQAIVFDHFDFHAKRLNKKLREQAVERMKLEAEDYQTYWDGEVYRYEIRQGKEVWYEGDGGWFGDAGIEELLKDARWEIDKPKCPHCNLTSAQTGGMSAIFHEKGCKNDGRVWNPDDQEWQDDNTDEEEF
jgi:hypothetical protein